MDPSVGPDRYAPIMIALPETTSKEFKLEFEVPDNLFKSFTEKDPEFETWDLSEIIVSEAAGLDAFGEKDLTKMDPTPLPAWNSYLWDPQNSITERTLKVQPQNVIDISEFMDETGPGYILHYKGLTK